MANYLQELENNEAILLMYLADELDAEDRAEVEQLLAVDANLRRELEHLATARGAMDRAFADADAAEPMLSADAAARRVGRMLRQATAERRRATAPPPPSDRRRLRYPWYAYPLAAAAAILLAFVAWWGNTPMRNGSFEQAVNYPSVWEAGGDESPTAAALRESFDAPFADSTDALDEMESQMASLYVASRAAPDLWLEAVSQ